MSHPRAALGFRVRSGRAIAVLLAGSPDAPELVDARVVALADPAVPQSVQPYHAALRDHQLRDLRAAERLAGIVRRATGRSVAAVLGEYRASGYRISRAALVVGSVTDPATIANQHMRAHALEGALFRTVLEEALRTAGLRCSLILERTAYAEGAAALARPAERLKRSVTDLGRGRSGPWRADEKLAALAAWTTLARAAPGSD